MFADYDEFPYPSYCYPQSSPEHLAAIGTLFGMTPPSLATARVLEFGSGMGGNLLPLAARFPEARFLGIDYSPVQTESARAAARALGLTNVDFDGRSILDIDQDLGPFDYVIAHGVYSWVTEEVRERMTDLTARWLSPQGIAYVSYNARPGWDAILPLRNAMLLHAQSARSLKERLAKAREILAFMLKNAGSEDSPYRRVIAGEAETIAGKSDAYLLHEYLADDNQPFHLTEVVDAAARFGLQYLGDAAVGTMPLGAASSGIEDLRQAKGNAWDPVRQEQYQDFMTNRRFRMSLFCRAGVRLARHPVVANVSRLRFVSECRPLSPVRPEAVGRIRHLPLTRRGKPVGTVRGRTLSACVMAAIEAGEGGAAFADLIRKSVATLGDVSRPMVEKEFLAGMGDLLMGRILDIALLPPQYAAGPSDSPRGFPPARLAAGRGEETVPNMCHREIHLTPAERRLLPLLDGSRDRGELARLAPGVGNLEEELSALAAAALLER